jgi:hypothetical protein
MALFYKKMLNNVVSVLVVILVILLFKIYIFDGTVEQLSQVDNKYYKVRNGKDKQQKANLLALINLKLQHLVNNLAKDPRYITDPAVQRLIKNWNKGVTLKETGNMESDAAYVINKRYMSFCIKDSTRLEDTNLMTYVGIHELAHIMSISTDHDREFINNFQFLLGYSANLVFQNPLTGSTEKLYIPLSQLNTADNYCGVKIKNSIN